MTVVDWTERREALRAAFTLGGRSAVLALLEPGEVASCPRCDGARDVPRASTRQDETAWLRAMGATMPCPFCGGQGHVWRTGPEGRRPSRFGFLVGVRAVCGDGWRTMNGERVFATVGEFAELVP